MIETTLSQVLGNGALVDNTEHRVRDWIFRAGSHRDDIKLRPERPKKKQNIWTLIQKAAEVHRETSELIFLTFDKEYEHNTDDPFIHVQGNYEGGFTLKTGNLIGSIRGYDCQLTVSSRFGDDFLKYIIADADGFLEIPDQGGVRREGYEWLLIYLWLVKLKKAFHLGLPKDYSTRTEELTRPRGRLDPVDYFFNPMRATYLCTYREHRYDSNATQLIARTLKHLESHSYLRGIQALNQTFQVAIQGQRTVLHDLLATPPMRNPYYAAYNPVIALSKRILRNELANFGGESQTSAFFFDVSMLFEYFIRKLLKRAGISLHSKNNRDWNIPRGLPNGQETRKLIPDLIFDIEGATYVFDVKYKSFDFKGGVNREDLFQLHTYIGQVSNRYNVGGCGFIYPVRHSRWEDCGLEKMRGIFTETIIQGGHSVPFHVAFIKVPEAQKEFLEFRNQFKIHLEKFVGTFLKRLLGDDIESEVDYLSTDRLGGKIPTNLVH
jgi:5-methylcytosine-specific restriction enzyme subunit McrC